MMYIITHYSADNKRTTYDSMYSEREAFALMSKLERELQSGEQLMLFHGATLVFSAQRY